MGGVNSKNVIGVDVLFAVCDEKSAANHDAIALEDCFDCPEWVALVRKCRNKLFLAASTFQAYNSLPNAKVLSYRWKDEISTVCSVTVPGIGIAAPQSCTFCVDAFDILKDFEEGYLWIDYLCHLNYPYHKVNIMKSMGPLYGGGEIVPAYLLNIDMVEIDGHINGIIDDRYIRYIGVKKQSSSVLLNAVRRGWIQQEISYGRLDRGVIKSFVNHCITHQYYGILGTFITRCRPNVLRWIFKDKDDITKYLLLLETTNDFMRQDIVYLIGRSDKPEGGGVSLVVQNAIRDAISDNLRQVSPDLHAEIVRNSKNKRDKLAERLHSLQAIEEKDAMERSYDDDDSWFSPSEELQQVTSQVWDFDQKKYFDIQTCGEESLSSAVSAIQPYLDQMVTYICEPVTFDYADFLGAYTLLRNFAESELSLESDAAYALTQVATYSMGIVDSAQDSLLSDCCLTLLRMCWMTVFTVVKKHKMYITLQIKRENSLEKTLGLLHLKSFFELTRTTEKQRKRGVFYRCGDLLIGAKINTIRIAGTSSYPDSSNDDVFQLKCVEDIFVV